MLRADAPALQVMRRNVVFQQPTGYPGTKVVGQTVEPRTSLKSRIRLVYGAMDGEADDPVAAPAAAATVILPFMFGAWMVQR